MNFSDALTVLKAGKTVTRKGWNGKELSLNLVPDEDCCNGMWIGFYKDNKLICPWTASQSDLLGDDWEMFDALF